MRGALLLLVVVVVDRCCWSLLLQGCCWLSLAIPQMQGKNLLGRGWEFVPPGAVIDPSIWKSAKMV